MNLDLFLLVLCGSLFGLSLRLFILKKFKTKICLTVNNIALINIISSLITGILLALDIKQGNLYFLLSIGFLGCFSTFSSFIYQLFNYLQEKKYVIFIKHYAEVILFSILIFIFGFWTTNLLLK